MQFQQAKSYINARLRKELPKHLFYHSVNHVKDVYSAAKRIAKIENVTGENLTLLLTAAWYHDCGFMVQAREHERISCEIATEHLPQFGYSSTQIKAICGMIMATQVPQHPYNHLEQIICDADLDYLGREDFFTIGNKLFQELQMYGIINDEKEWDQLQIKFLEQHHFFTDTAIATRKGKKDEYLRQLKNKLGNTQ